MRNLALLVALLAVSSFASAAEDAATKEQARQLFEAGNAHLASGEVEAALSECPGVGEAVVVGVPDEKWGEVGRAFVVCRSEAPVTAEQIIADVRRRLAGYKVPKSVVVVDELPRLGSGKVDRAALEAR